MTCVYNRHDIKRAFVNRMLKRPFRSKAWKKEEDRWNNITKSFRNCTPGQTFFSVVQKPTSDLDLPIIEVCRSHTIRHTHTHTHTLCRTPLNE